MPNKLIYFPSLSAGNSRAWFLKNSAISPTLNSRFYEQGYNERLYHPYFLLTAGALYKKMDIREEMGLKDAIVMGDSGGHQIATGFLKWNKDIRHDIFLWLENNSDIAMNIDIPSRGIYGGKFNEALSISVDNFKYFADHQTGKTKFLNVLQGMANSHELGTIWYDQVKDFQFHGWSFGGGKTIENTIYVLAFFLENGELLKPHNRILHYLGATTPLHILSFAMVQKVLNKHFGEQYTVTTDSSSPNMASVYGQYYTGIDWNTLAFNHIQFQKSKKELWNMDAPLPCVINCPVCYGRTIGDISKIDEYHYMILTQHNLAVFTDAFKFVNSLFENSDDILQEFLSADLFAVYKSINDIFDSGTPLHTYNKYLPLYRKLSNLNKVNTDVEATKTFFEF